MPFAEPDVSFPANVETSGAAGTHGDSDGVALTLAVRLPVTDGDAGDAVSEADRDALPLREKLTDSEKDGETAVEALALPDAEREGEAVRDAEPDALALREAVIEGEPLGDWQFCAMSTRRMRLLR
jgi:hypothetical protein